MVFFGLEVRAGRLALAAAAAALGAALAGCGTVKGMGSDITSVAQAAGSVVGLGGRPTNRGGVNVYDPETATWHH